MAAAGITIVKTFNYRGQPEEWANTYHLTDAAADPAAWRALADILIGMEATVYSNRVTVVRALCYNDTSNPATYVYLLADFAGEVPGAMSPSLGDVAPGDTAAWVRWATGLLNSKGKPIYLRKYFHDVCVGAGTNADVINAVQKGFYDDLGVALLSPLDGTISMADPNARIPDGPSASSTYATTRTLKRRGPRP